MFDQELARMRDCIPRTWWALYQGSVAAGFTEAQAVALLQTFILGAYGIGIRPPTTNGPPPDEVK